MAVIPWSDAFIANVTVIGDQDDPVVAALADGRFVVAWHDRSGSRSIDARIFNADGSPASGSETVIASGNFTGIGEPQPAITTLSDGRVLISWGEAGDVGPDVEARAMDSDGNPIGAQVQLRAGDTDGVESLPSLATLSNGKLLATWIEENRPVAAFVTVDGIGSTVGDSFALLSGKAFEDGAATVSSSATKKGFVAAFDVYNGDSEDRGVYARTYDADGDLIRSQRVNQAQAGDQYDPAVTGLKGGGFVVAWADASDAVNTGTNVKARVYAANGKAVGGEFIVDPDAVAGNQHRPAVAALPDGGFVVFWESDVGGDNAIVGQVFNAKGKAASDAFTIDANIGVSDRLAPVAVAALPDGRFVVTWNSGGHEEGGSGLGVRAQVFDPRDHGIAFAAPNGGGEFYGTEFADTMKGGTGVDKLHGGDGDDVLTGGDGKDILDGGKGFDIADFSDRSGNIGVTLDGFIATDVFVDNVAEDTVVNIEGVIGTSFDDELTGDNFDNWFRGGGGQDEMFGGGGFDIADFSDQKKAVVLTLDGSNTAVSTIGGDFGDSVNGIEGIVGGKAGDTLTGDGEDNWFRGGPGKDIIDGGDGTDTVDFSDQSKAVVLTLKGDSFSTAKIGGKAADTVVNVENIIGGKGNDKLVGSIGDHDNLFRGGAGKDTIDGQGANDNDTVDFSDQTKSVVLTLSNDGSFATATIGGKAADKVANVESIVGGTADDTLTGNFANNRLDGGLGKDTLSGGEGSDFFIFRAGQTVGDTVTDFDALDDVVYLSKKGFGVSGVITDIYLNGALPTDTTHVFYFMNGTLYFDADGNGADFAAKEIATFTDVTDLPSGNVFLID